MSYLNALLRASGLAGAPRPAPHREDAGAVAELSFQTREVHEPTPVTARAEHRSAELPSRESHAPVPDRRADARSRSVDSPPGAIIEPEIPASTDVSIDASSDERTISRVLASAPAPLSAPTTPRNPTKAPAPIEPAPPVLQGMDAVRAAMRWVAAEPRIEVRHEVSDVAEARITAKPLTPQHLPTRTDDTDTRQRIDKVAIPEERLRQARPALATASASEPKLSRQPWRTAPVTPEERAVEISIGSINVKVDPPPAQTAVRSPAPAARGPATSRIPTRSPLARRALRRV